MAERQFHKFYFKARDKADNTQNAVLSTNAYSCTQPLITRTNNKVERNTREAAMSYDDPGTFAEEGEFSINDDPDLQWLKMARIIEFDLTDDPDQVADTGLHKGSISVLHGEMFIDTVTPSNEGGIKRLTIAYSINGATSTNTALI